jgi:hypothetical protein
MKKDTRAEQLKNNDTTNPACLRNRGTSMQCTPRLSCLRGWPKLNELRQVISAVSWAIRPHPDFMVGGVRRTPARDRPRGGDVHTEKWALSQQNTIRASSGSAAREPTVRSARAVKGHPRPFDVPADLHATGLARTCRAWGGSGRQRPKRPRPDDVHPPARMTVTRS